MTRPDRPERGVLVVQTCPEPGREAEFESWYDTVHVPEILATPGFVRGRRFRTLDGPWSSRPAGEWRSHLAIYDIVAEDLTASYAALLDRMANGGLTRSAVFSTDEPYRSQVFRQLGDVRG